MGAREGGDDLSLDTEQIHHRHVLMHVYAVGGTEDLRELIFEPKFRHDIKFPIFMRHAPNLLSREAILVISPPVFLFLGWKAMWVIAASIRITLLTWAAHSRKHE